MRLHSVYHTPHRRRLAFWTLVYLVTAQCLMQIQLLRPVNADLDLMTKLKLIGLLALTNKIKLVPLPLPIPVPIHIEGKDEVVYVNSPPSYKEKSSYAAAASHTYPVYVPYGPSEAYNYGHEHPYRNNYHSSQSYNQHRPSMLQTDYSGHASEIVPVSVLPSGSLRYGDRISNKPRQENRPAPTPTRPNHLQRGRVVVRQRTVERPRYENVPSPVPLKVPDHSYQPEQPSKIQEPVRIAYIPLKTSDLTDVNEQRPPLTYQPESQNQAMSPLNSDRPELSSSEYSNLPEHLLKYIRQVQPTSNDSSAERDESKTKSTQSTSGPTETDKWLHSHNQTNTNMPTELSEINSQPAPESDLPLTQIRPNSLVVDHQAPITSSPPVAFQNPSIQPQWQPGPDYNPAAYQYRAPELKVIRTRYNPKQQMEEQLRYQQPPKFNAQSSYAESSPVGPSGNPHPTQFIYSVSHAQQPIAPYFAQSPFQYPTVDNFGLEAFRNGQSQKQKLTQAATFEFPIWSKPPSQSKAHSIFSNFSKRLSKLL